MKKAKLKEKKLSTDERLELIAGILVDKLIYEIQNKTLDKKFIVDEKILLKGSNQ